MQRKAGKRRGREVFVYSATTWSLTPSQVESAHEYTIEGNCRAATEPVFICSSMFAAQTLRVAVSAVQRLRGVLDPQSHSMVIALHHVIRSLDLLWFARVGLRRPGTSRDQASLHSAFRCLKELWNIPNAL